MSSIKKTAIFITIITLAAKLLGFGREITLAYFYGTSYVVDSYLIATSVPTIFFGWLNSVGVSYTPIYSDIRANLGDDKSKRFTNNLISIVLVVAALCAILGLIFSKQIVSIIAPGFDVEAYNMTVSFLNISIWIVIFTSTSQILTAYLNCNNKFVQSNTSNLAISATQMAVIFASGLLGDYVLIYGVLLSNILYFIILYVLSDRNGLKFKFEVHFSPEIKKAFIIAGPIFISSMIMQINTFVDKMFASQLNEGSIAALNYSSIIKQFVFYIFSIAVTTMSYPILSQYIAEKNLIRVKEVFSKSLNIIIILFVPITIGAIILSEPAITFVYERGQFGHDSTLMTSSAFIMYSIGLLPLAIREVITKVFYAMQDTKSNLYIGIIAVLSNVLLNAILIKPMGHSGLALATSLSSFITLPLFFIVLRRKLGGLGLKDSLVLLIKSCISGLAMGLVVYYVYEFISFYAGNRSITLLLNIIVTVCVGGLTYFVLMMVMKVKQIEIFTDIIHDILIRLKIKI